MSVTFQNINCFNENLENYTTRDQIYHWKMFSHTCRLYYDLWVKTMHALCAHRSARNARPHATIPWNRCTKELLVLVPQSILCITRNTRATRTTTIIWRILKLNKDSYLGADLGGAENGGSFSVWFGNFGSDGRWFCNFGSDFESLEPDRKIRALRTRVFRIWLSRPKITTKISEPHKIRTKISEPPQKKWTTIFWSAQIRD